MKGVKELWTGKSVTCSDNGFPVIIPSADVRLYRIEKKTSTGIAHPNVGGGGKVEINYGLGSLSVKASKAVVSVGIYDMQGMIVVYKTFGEKLTRVGLPIDCATGVYLVKVKLESGDTVTKKIFVA